MGACYSKKSQQMPQDYMSKTRIPDTGCVHKPDKEREDSVISSKSQSIGLRKPYGGRYSQYQSSALKCVPKDRVLENVADVNDNNLDKDAKTVNTGIIEVTSKRAPASNRFGFKRTVVSATVHAPNHAEEDVKEIHIKEAANLIHSIPTKQQSTAGNLLCSQDHLSTNSNVETSSKSSKDSTPGRIVSIPNNTFESDSVKSRQNDILEKTFNGADGCSAQDKKNGDCSKLNKPFELNVTFKAVDKRVAPIAAAEMVESLESPSLMSVDSDDLMLETEVDLGDFDYSDDLLDISGGLEQDGAYRAEYLMSRSISESRKQRRQVTYYQRTSSREDDHSISTPEKRTTGSISSQECSFDGVFNMAEDAKPASSSIRINPTVPKAIRPTSLPSNPSQVKSPNDSAAEDQPNMISVFKPPRAYSLGDSDSVTLDGCTYRQLMQEVTIMKAMLFKLQRLMQKEERGSPVGASNTWQKTSNIGSIFASKAFAPDESSSEQIVQKLTQTNEGLKQEKSQLEKQLTERDQTIQLLQQQLTKYECEPTSALQGPDRMMSSRKTDTDQLTKSGVNRQLSKASTTGEVCYKKSSSRNGTKNCELGDQDMARREKTSEKIVVKTSVDEAVGWKMQQQRVDSPSTEESSGFEDMLSLGCSQAEEREVELVNGIKEGEVASAAPTRNTASTRSIAPTRSTAPMRSADPQPTKQLQKSSLAAVRSGVFKKSAAPAAGKTQPTVAVNKENVSSAPSPGRTGISAGVRNQRAIKQGTDSRPQSARSDRPTAEKSGTTQGNIPRPASKTANQSKLPTFNNKPSRLRPPTVRNH